jgi:hypothetical protein
MAIRSTKPPFVNAFAMSGGRICVQSTPPLIDLKTPDVP